MNYSNKNNFKKRKMDYMNTYYKSFIFTTSLVFAYSYWYLNNNENAIILKDYDNIMNINPTSEQINVHIVSEALQGTSKTLLIIHGMHLYFYVLNLIFSDIECIINYHILCVIFYISNIYSMSFFKMNTWLILFGSLCSSKYILVIGKEIYLLIY